MAKIPEFVVGLPPETFISGQTVYWWNGEHWQAHEFLGYYPEAGAARVRVRGTQRERIVLPFEIISRERYLKYKATQTRR